MRYTRELWQFFHGKMMIKSAGWNGVRDFQTTPDSGLGLVAFRHWNKGKWLGPFKHIFFLVLFLYIECSRTIRYWWYPKSFDPYPVQDVVWRVLLTCQPLQPLSSRPQQHFTAFTGPNGASTTRGKAVVKQCKSDMEPYVIFGCLPFTCTTNKTSADDGYQVFLGGFDRLFILLNLALTGEFVHVTEPGPASFWFPSPLHRSLVLPDRLNKSGSKFQELRHWNILVPDTCWFPVTYFVGIFPYIGLT